MQQKIEDGMIYVRASKEESATIRSWRMMNFDRAQSFWYAPISIGLLEKLQANGGLIPPAKIALSELKKIQDAVDRERVKPDKDLKPYIDPPVKAKLYAHQKRSYNMALIHFGLVSPE